MATPALRFAHFRSAILPVWSPGAEATGLSTPSPPDWLTCVTSVNKIDIQLNLSFGDFTLFIKHEQSFAILEVHENFVIFISQQP
jgi:hypothetical protein